MLTSDPIYVWYTEKGVRGSTTHNVYGVYDMSGGRFENTAGYYSGSSSTYISKLKVLGSAKCVDKYTSHSPSGPLARLAWDADTAANGWDVTSRGGNRAWTTLSGIFSFGGGTSDGSACEKGFRMALFGISL